MTISCYFFVEQQPNKKGNLYKIHFLQLVQKKNLLGFGQSLDFCQEARFKIMKINHSSLGSFIPNNSATLLAIAKDAVSPGDSIP